MTPSDKHDHQPVITDEPDVAYLKKQVSALVALLGKKGIMPYHEFLAEVHRLETVDHGDGARVVAHAWTNADYKQRLLTDAKAAVRELGIEPGSYDELKVVENTDRLHNVVVCTTCSCVPSPMSGITPDWYKGAPYRSRVIDQSREVLREFGLELPDEVEIRVIDTDIHHRVMVLPQRPAGASGLTEAQLALLVTQESLFGVGLPAGPVGA